MVLLPIGSIIMWKNSQGSIPEGWAVCNGANGTPDLRGMFIMGASNDGEVGSGGASAVHSHTRPANTGSDGYHRHPMSISLGSASGTESNVGGTQYGVSVASAGHGHSGGSGYTGYAAAHAHTVGGNTDERDIAPPHVILHYIMRIE